MLSPFSPSSSSSNQRSYALEISGLVKDLGPVAALDGKMVRILDGVDFRAAYGEVTVLMGANGAGKSTTLACAQGMMPANGGEIRLLGQDPYDADARLRARVGVMLQDGGLPPSVRPLELLEHLAKFYENSRSVGELSEMLDLDSLKSTPIRRLSGGERQRVAFAAALVGNPEVLFLDEPTAGLDPESRSRIFNLIDTLRRQGVCIILTTHLLDDAERLADYVYILNHGVTVAHGTLGSLMSRSDQDHQVLTFTTGEPVDVRHGVPDAFEVRELTPGEYEVQGTLDALGLHALSTWWLENRIDPTAISLQPRSLEHIYFEYAAKDAQLVQGSPGRPNRVRVAEGQQ